MDDGGAVLAVLTVVALLALIPATVASNKGRSFFGWWLFGWAFFLPALVAALVVSDQTQQRALRSGSARRCPHCRGVVPRSATACQHCGRDLERPRPTGRTPAPRPAGQTTSSHVTGPAPQRAQTVDLDALERLADLHDRGVLDDVEFTEQKTRLLAAADGHATASASTSERPAWIDELAGNQPAVADHLWAAGAVTPDGTPVTVDQVTAALGYRSNLTARTILAALQDDGRVEETADGGYRIVPDAP